MKPRKNRRTQWTEEERQKLKTLFERFDGDIDQTAKELRRGERSVRMNLFFMGLIREDEVDRANRNTQTISSAHTVVC